LPAGSTCYDPDPVTRHFTSFSQAAARMSPKSRSKVSAVLRSRNSLRHDHGIGKTNQTFVAKMDRVMIRASTVVSDTPMSARNFTRQGC
jgi:hypothetical protein